MGAAAEGHWSPLSLDGPRAQTVSGMQEDTAQDVRVAAQVEIAGTGFYFYRVEFRLKERGSVPRGSGGWNPGSSLENGGEEAEGRREAWLKEGRGGKS